MAKVFKWIAHALKTSMHHHECKDPDIYRDRKIENERKVEWLFNFAYHKGSTTYSIVNHAYELQ